MNNKDRLQMYVSLTKITIVLCWLSLFSFWAIKLFGGNWFDIMVTNENFVKFCHIIQTTWCKYLLSFATVFIANYLILCSIAQKFYFSKAKSIFMFWLIASIWAVSNFAPVDFLYLPFWYAYAIMVVWGVVHQKSWRRLYGFVAIALQFAFTTVSMLIRSVPIEIYDNYFMAIILSIDTYIMFGLYYLYSNLIALKRN